MMKNDRDELKCLLHEGLNRLETSLKNDVRQEAKHREKMGEYINARIGSVLDRIAKLEISPPTGTPTASPTPSDSWTPNHIIFGGWDDSVPNEQLCKDMELLVQQLPESTHALRLRPAPR